MKLNLKEYIQKVESGESLNEMGQQNLDVKQMPGTFSITDRETDTNITTTNPGVVDAAKKGELQIGKVLETEDDLSLDDIRGLLGNDADEKEMERDARREALRSIKQYDPDEYELQRERMATKGFDYEDEELDEGKKVDRMVKHIIKSEMDAGKSREEAEKIAWATANKRGMLDNKNKLDESMMESGLQRILNSHPYEHKSCQEGWGMDESLYEALVDHYFNEGRIPRAVWHGPESELRDWVEECYAKDTGMLLDEEVMEDPLLPGATLEGAMDDEEDVDQYDDESIDSINDFIGQRSPSRVGSHEVGHHFDNFGGFDELDEASPTQNKWVRGGRERDADTPETRRAKSDYSKVAKARENFFKRGRNPSERALVELLLNVYETNPEKGLTTDSPVLANYDVTKDEETGKFVVTKKLGESKKAKPDFLDVDKDGDKEEPMKKALHDKEDKVDEGKKSYSAKSARAGKDIGKPGKNFAKIADKAAKEYGSKEAGERVAGAVLAKLRKESVQEQLDKYYFDTKPVVESSDEQVMNWEKQFSEYLTEGQSVSINIGNENMPDSVTVTANDKDAHALIKLLQNAGMGGVVGAADKIAHTVGDNSLMSTEPVEQGEQDVEVIGFDDAQKDLKPSDDNGNADLSFLKKMLGQEVSMTPAKSGAVVYGEEEEVEEGNKFTGNLAKARAAGKDKADLDGDGDLEDVKEGEYVPDDVHINPNEKFAKEKGEAHNKAVEKAKQMAKEKTNKVKEDRDDYFDVDSMVDDYYSNTDVHGTDADEGDEDEHELDEGEWDGTAMADMAAGMAQSAEDAAADGTDEAEAQAEKVGEGKHQHTCNECGSVMEAESTECMECGYMEESDHDCGCDHDCDCDDKSEKLDEWANQVNRKNGIGQDQEDEQFQAEMDYMLNMISGGLNGRKVDNTTLPHTRVRTETMEDVNFGDLQKLAGLK